MNSRNGQILIEVIIAGLIIVMMSLAITQAITSSVRGLNQTMTKTAAVFLSQELTQQIRAIAIEDWHNITNLATTSANKYHVSTTTPNKWATLTETADIVLNSITYTHYVYFEDVYRLNKDIVSSSTPGSYVDPSTIKVVAAVEWTDPEYGANSFSQSAYLSRFFNETFPLTDWIGGAIGTPKVITGATTTFATSSSIDYSTTGTIKLQIQ